MIAATLLPKHSLAFAHTAFGKGGPVVLRLGLSTTYWPGRKAVHLAIDRGVNVFFGFGIDRQMYWVLREAMQAQREQFVVVTGAYNYIWGHSNIRKTLERRLRALRTEYIDAFLFLGVLKEDQFPLHVRDELVRLREEGKVRRIGLSTHDRKLAGRLAAEGALDAFMVRYNAAHPGADVDVFPHLAAHDPALISYTATRWSFLLRRPKGYPRGERVPTAAECYRFVLSNPHVDVCLTAPYNLRQLEHNLTALEAGPLSEEDMAFMRAFGERVHAARQWFM